MARLCSSVLLSLLIALPGSAVTMDWTPIGNPNNSCDPLTDAFGVVTGCLGTVPYPYEIGTYEVTNAQYAEFLNAKATSDPLGLYSESMSKADIANQSRGGIETQRQPRQLHLQHDRRSRELAGGIRLVLRRAALRKLDE
jgi:formylglycine-generating enzyme required for sulfatase activity